MARTLTRCPIRIVGANSPGLVSTVRTRIQPVHAEMARAGRYTIDRGGMAVVVGAPTAALELPPDPLLTGERTLIGSIGGSCSPSRDIPTFIDWWKAGSLDLEHLVTTRYPLDQVNDAVADLKAGRIEGRALLDVSSF